MARAKDKAEAKELAWFKLFTNTLKLTLVMKPTDVGNAFIAVAKLICLGQAPENLKAAAQVLYAELVKAVEDSDTDYRSRCARNRENGKKHRAKAADGSAPEPTGNPVGSDLLPDGTEERSTEDRRTEERSIEERRKSGPPAFTPPTRQDVLLFCQQEGLQVDADRFVNYYTANGWYQGNTPIRDWRACVRNWCRRDQEGACGPSRQKSGPAPSTQASPIALQAIQRLLAEEAAQSDPS